MIEQILLSIELGDFKLGEGFPLLLLWLILGLVLLSGLTFFAIKSYRRSSPDPFEL